MLVVGYWLCNVVFLARPVHPLPLLDRFSQHVLLNHGQLGLNCMLVKLIFHDHEPELVLHPLQLGRLGRHLQWLFHLVLNGGVKLERRWAERTWHRETICDVGMV